MRPVLLLLASTMFFSACEMWALRRFGDRLAHNANSLGWTLRGALVVVAVVGAALVLGLGLEAAYSLIPSLGLGVPVIVWGARRFLGINANPRDHR